MMSKVFQLIGLFLIPFSATAFSATVDFTNDPTPSSSISSYSSAAFTIKGFGSDNDPKSVFDYGTETPALYLKLPDNISGGTVNKTVWTEYWNFGSRSTVELPLNASAGPYADTFVPLSIESVVSPAAWQTIKQPGVWEIYNITYAYLDGDNIIQQGSYIGNGGIANFTVTSPTVTPEPASMLLFGLGAGVLGLAGRRKKNR